MKIALVFLILTAVLTPIRAMADLEAQASLSDEWRWSELNSLSGYDILRGAKGDNGTIWFAHYNGFLSYNGLEIIDHPIPDLYRLQVQDLFVTSDNRLILTGNNSYLIWEDGDYQIFDLPSQQFGIRNGIVEGTSGQILIASSRSVYELTSEGLIRIETPVTDISSILLDPQGKLWVGQRGNNPLKVFELNMVAGKPIAVMAHEFPPSGENQLGPWLFLDSNGTVFSVSSGEDFHLRYFENYQPATAFKVEQNYSFIGQSMEIIESAQGDLWFCMSRKLARWNSTDLEIYNIEDYPLPSSFPYMFELDEGRILLGGYKLTPQIVNLSKERWVTYPNLNFQCEDQQGGLWFIAKNRDVIRWQGEMKNRYSAADGLIDTPNRIIVGSDGSIWVSGAHKNQAAVAILEGDNWQRHSFPGAGRTFSYLAAIETRSGEFVFGGGTPHFLLGDAPGGAVIFRRENNEFIGKHYPPPSFTERTANIVERADEGLLFSVGSVFRVNPDGTFTDQTEGLFVNRWIDHMMVDQHNNLWVASLGDGIYKYDGEQWEFPSEHNGLETKNPFYLLEDRQNDRIITLTDEGFYYYDGTSWSRWGAKMNRRFMRENHTVFQTSDGAIWLNFASRPWLLEQKDFGDHNYTFKTIRYMPDDEPPQTRASISSERFPEGSQIHVTFEAADAWDETQVEDLVFSWKMNDGEWSPFTSKASITFNNLSSGDHQLSVRARDSVGNIDPTPASVTFSVTPPLWKKAWFIASMIAAIGLIAWLVHSLYRTRIKAALALDEFKLDFFTNISHELRNPLAVIISPVEMMLESTKDPGSRNLLEMVLRNARKMQSMVNQLLEFRKMEKKVWSIRPESGEIIGFTRDTINEHEPLWRAKGQQLTITSPVESQLCSFDTDVLHKIINNLISNAIKYSKDKAQIRVTIGIDEQEDQSYIYVLTVEDDGVGIPAHEHDNILQPFYRVKGRTKEDGSGVGLAIVNQLVNLWGGLLTIDSPLRSDGRGSRFTIELPLEPAEDTVTEEEKSVQESRNDNAKIKRTLLFIEDNEDMRNILLHAFSSTYKVLEAADGISGFEAAFKHDPDLIVSDVMMPGMDGMELCEKLKNDQETSHIPVILLTAKGSTEHRIEGIKSGADAYIAKPLDIKHLRARIENLLESRHDLKVKFTQQLVVEATEITVTPTDELILRKAIKTVEEHMQDESFDVVRFGELMAMSRSTLKRKIKAVTGLSPQPFIQKIRLKRAAQLLESSDRSVSEIAAMVGYYDPSYFGKIFKKEFGVPPSSFGDRS